MKKISACIWTTALLGILAGGSISILFILIPYWRTLQPQALMTWFQDFGTMVGKVMLPMELLPLLASAYCLFTAVKLKQNVKKLWLLINISNLIILSMLFIYFIPVNLSFINKTITIDAVPAEFNRWQLVHGARTFFTLLSLILGVSACKTQIKNEISV